jgi:signal transduction histidine kinase
VNHVKSEEVIDWLEQERKRLARDIHDGPAQALTNASMRLEIMKKLLENDQISYCFQEIERIQSILRGAMNETRRLLFDLRPSFLESGLENAIYLYAERFTQTYGLPVTVEGTWGGKQFTSAVEVSVFRVFQEILSNAYKHASASSVCVLLEAKNQVCRLVVTDDGIGFDTDVQAVTSFGLRGMRERMNLIGGKLYVNSQIGKGTRVVVEVTTDE